MPISGINWASAAATLQLLPTRRIAPTTDTSHKGTSRSKLAAWLTRTRFRQQQGASEENLEKEFQDWKTRVDTFLKQHLGPDHRERFLPEPYVPPATKPAWVRRLHEGLEPSAFEDRVKAKVELLQRFIDEL